MKISIIIPTYNEKGNLIKLIKEIEKKLKKFSYEIIVIDDDSQDLTGKIAKKIFNKNKRIKIFIRKKRGGLASAILFGIKKSKGEIIIGMDADFNHPPQLISKLIKNLKNNDLVIASRFINGGGMEEKLRYFFTFLFNLFLKYILGFPTMDNMSGFYAIKKEKLKILSLEKIYQGYGEYHLRLVWYTKKSNFKIKEIPVYYQKRRYGKSKSNLIKMLLKYTIEALKLKVFNKNFLL
ncbi:MAG: hypothetical protein Fur009_6240 [Candidatus Microgenomates bacterium]